jgi:type I restriction enzyme S subunit
MSNLKKNNTAYKQTPIGLIPNEWEVKKLGELVEIRSGISPTLVELKSSILNFPYLKVEDLNNCDKYQNKSREYTDDKKLIIPINSIIFPKRGAAILNNKVRINQVQVLMDSNLMAITTKNIKLNYEYLYYQIINIQLFKIADTSTIPQINNKHIEPFKIPIPPLPEQQKIATILSTWDTAIDHCKSIIENIKTRNKGLAENLLTGKIRVKGFEKTKWKMVPMNEIFERTQDKNLSEKDEYEVLTISGKLGFVSQNVKFSRVIAGNSLKNYTLLNRGEFSYNKGNSKTYQYGCVFRLDDYDKALVPNVYISFKPLGNIDTSYYSYYFKLDFLKPSLAKIISSGARMDGLLNVNANDFFRIKVPFPTIQEQIKNWTNSKCFHFRT